MKGDQGTRSVWFDEISIGTTMGERYMKQVEHFAIAKLVMFFSLKKNFTLIRLII